MAIFAFFIHKRSVHQALNRLLEISHPSSTKRFFIHKRSVHQVLDPLLEISHSSPTNPKNHDELDDDDNPFDGEDHGMSSASIPLDDESLERSRRISCSMANVVLKNDRNNLDFIPYGLPLLQTATSREDKTVNYSTSVSRMPSIGRLMTPRSPGGNAFESGADSGG